uniref:Uncharacterized protein n=1 Tax=Panagrolaimus davidi TaxID=227884 RepID=A0A914Q4L1_9BILA
MEHEKSPSSKIVFLAKPSDWALKLSPHQMHLNEIRMLKDEIKSLRTNNQQLQDICCFLDEDRHKTRQLSKEWQKFGKYTSDLMKQHEKSSSTKIVFSAKPSDWALKLSPHQMHLNEIRMLKDEIKSLRTNNQQLQDICCFLDEDRQKTRQLSKEWQKFGKYTSDLMKQEITAYQQRIQEQQTRHQQLLSENDELKRLCLYLDEQRQAIIAQATAMAEEAVGTEQMLYRNSNDADSSDAGCGSSARSSDSEREYISSKVEKIGQPDAVEFNHEREKALRQLAKTMAGNDVSIEESEAEQNISAAHNDRLFNYIQSLESRIKSLEHQNTGSSSRFSNCSFESSEDLHENQQLQPQSRNHSHEPKQTIRILSHLSCEDSTPNNTISRQAFCNKMFESTTSTMTSSGTTYCSSETDESAATAVFVMGDEEDGCNPHLEVRTLGPIDEETENDSESCIETTIVKPLKVNGCNRISSSSEASSSGTSTTGGGGGENGDNETEESGIEAGEDLPPKMPLIGESAARLSLCSSNLSLDNCSNSSSSRLSAGTNRSLPEEYCSLGRSKAPPPYSQAQLRHRPSFNAPPHSSFSRPRIIPQHSTLAEAVKSFQSGEDPCILRKLCQNAWDSLERQKNNNNNSTKSVPHSLSSDAAHITAV